MLHRLCNPLKSRSFFLFGARGVGKTTLLKALLPQESCHFVNLLMPREHDELALDPQLLAARCKALPATISWVVIDEVQKLPRLLDVVHSLIEDTQLKFALTGSSARKLKRSGVNLLAGRASVYYLHPLTARERASNFALAETLEWGSMPSLLTMTSDEERVDYLQSYAYTYLKEEIGAEQAVRRLEPFRKFLAVAAQSNTKIINYKKIAADVGVSSVTVKSYFQVLEDTLVGTFLEPFHESVRKSQRQNPKFYLFDAGVARALNFSLDLKIKERTSAYGEAFEGFLINEVIRLSHYSRKDYRLSYLRTKDDAEIDLIIDSQKEGRYLIEIKSTDLVTESQVTGLRRFASDIEHTKAFLVSRDPNPKQFGTVLALPWWVALEQLFPQ